MSIINLLNIYSLAGLSYLFIFSYLFVYLFICLFIYLYNYLFTIYLFIYYLFIYLLFIYLFVYLIKVHSLTKMIWIDRTLTEKRGQGETRSRAIPLSQEPMKVVHLQMLLNCLK